MSNEASVCEIADMKGCGGAQGRPDVESHDQSTFHPTRTEWVKRLIDVIGAVLLIAFFLFAFTLIGLILLVRHGRPVLYSHQRVGRGGVPFGCLKFRTMHREADRLLEEELRRPDARREWEATGKLKRDPRVHGMGNLLRRSSLDELPQLLNVLAGSMSLVGPRPVLRRELIEYGSRVDCYLTLRPGLTGLWQVSGRNDTTYADRVRLDERYFHERSVRLDIIILLRTVKAVLLAKGAY